MDPVQVEFLKLKKDVGSEFRKVESIANSIKQMERQNMMGDTFSQRE